MSSDVLGGAGVPVRDSSLCRAALAAVQYSSALVGASAATATTAVYDDDDLVVQDLVLARWLPSGVVFDNWRNQKVISSRAPH